MLLEKGKRYWCGWASRYAVYTRTIEKYNPITGGKDIVHQFRDVCDCLIECEEQNIEKWVK